MRQSDSRTFPDKSGSARQKLQLSHTFFGSPGTWQSMPQQENLTGL
jgi:hypothetical protein